MKLPSCRALKTSCSSYYGRKPCGKGLRIDYSVHPPFPARPLLAYRLVEAPILRLNGVRGPLSLASAWIC